MVSGGGGGCERNGWGESSVCVGGCKKEWIVRIICVGGGVKGMDGENYLCVCVWGGGERNGLGESYLC